ncbi:MAG: DUF4474 domain-containing protein [Oscillospiraceae bacterium]|nr:DUF4474 domain-containing protein [Oscillospiraceae bacterium]
MKMDKSKSTIIALIALVIVCGGSFVGVKMLNNKTAVKAATDTVSVSYTTMPSSSVSSTSTMPTTAAATSAFSTTASVDIPSTLPIATLKSEENNDKDEKETTKLNPFTTFGDVQNAGTTTTKRNEGSATTKKVETTSATKASTTAATTKTNEEKTTAAKEIIKNAAVFSDGFLSYMFNPDGDYYFTVDDPWQRNFGFNELYDVGAPFVVFYYDTMRCKFNYDQKDWLIQFWKGQYGFVFIGAEIGVYNKPESRTAEHFDCASDEDSLMMSMTFYRDGKELLTRDYAKYWWCTGFVPGKLDKFSDRSELSIKCRITMKDYKMLIGMAGALKENGMELNKDYTTSGLDMFITWQ